MQKPWIKDLSHEPMQYQRGWTEFYKLKFKLTRDVLIPRPETELLVDEVIKISRDCFVANAPRNDVIASPAKQSISIIDVGTGSGCIAISIAKKLPDVKIWALDISKKALEVAEKNSKFHKTNKQILFLESDLLSVFCHPEPSKGSLTNVKTSNELRDSSLIAQNDNSTGYIINPDIIVANLPYIPTASLMRIDPMVTEWEPKIALDGGQDGFALYNKLFTQMKERNIIPKYLVAEIDETQGDIALHTAQYYFPQAKAEIKKDLAARIRILMIRF